jgi:hypothetical protein
MGPVHRGRLIRAAVSLLVAVAAIGNAARARESRSVEHGARCGCKRVPETSVPETGVPETDVPDSRTSW